MVEPARRVRKVSVCLLKKGDLLAFGSYPGESLWALFKIGLLPMLVNFKIVIF